MVSGQGQGKAQGQLTPQPLSLRLEPKPKPGARGVWRRSYTVVYFRVGASCVGHPMCVCAVLAPLRRVKYV